MAVVDLHPLPVSRNPARRLPQLLAGLVLYGTSMAMQVRGTLGLNPWDVLHEGLTRHTSLSFGLVTAITGVASAAYIGARLDPGPRDGLMTGLAARTGWSLRLVRTDHTSPSQAHQSSTSARSSRSGWRPGTTSLLCTLARNSATSTFRARRRYRIATATTRPSARCAAATT